MLRYQWGRLNKQQVGAYCEYFVKMELTMHGFQVYTTEVDDRGIDFVCRHGAGPFLQVQVKSARALQNVFMFKSKFELADNLYLALGLLLSDGDLPQLYFIPSTAWRTPDTLFCGNDYGEGLKSKPEWRLNLSLRNMKALETYRFESTIDRLVLNGWTT
ncbi:hypothetical protein [Acidisoma sp. L85]|jgi:hypothetical protein|uniref:hypothetical protein n=1 Tax=Acidisoma sp. L85 TaxID=1641850 RepID=UPI001C20A6A5|nr:hypothetical protein [Acidisoma sp. L85]